MSIRFLPVALIAVIVASVAVGGAALAVGIGTEKSEKTDDLLERTASELGVDTQTLKDALSQAQAEIVTERQQELLAKLVEAEVITQEQANEASVWISQMPEAVNGLMRPELLLRLAATAFGDVIVSGTHSAAPLFGSDVTGKMAEILGIDAVTLQDALSGARQSQAEDSRAQVVNDLIDRLVEDGEITAAEGSEIKDWLAAVPEWVTEDGMLLRLFSHGAIGGLDAAPFLPEFEHRFGSESSDTPFHNLPELQQRGEPFFFMPDGQFPRFNFGAPENSNGEVVPQRRFFFSGPEGEFNFDGEVPPEFEHLFKDPEGFRFGEGFDFGELERLLEQFGLPNMPPQPGEDPDTVNAEKGA